MILIKSEKMKSIMRIQREIYLIRVKYRTDLKILAFEYINQLNITNKTNKNKLVKQILIEWDNKDMNRIIDNITIYNKYKRITKKYREELEINVNNLSNLVLND